MDMTPANIQEKSELTHRRIVFITLVLVTWGLLLMMAWNVLAYDGWSLVDMAFFACFVIGTPWSVLGFWNALIGLWFLHFDEEGMQKVAPYGFAGEENTPVTVKTAILMTLRNEDPMRALSRLKAVKDSLNETKDAAAFTFFVLSDTNQDAIAWREEEISKEHGFIYRRRTDNKGYKAGNVREFCGNQGREYDYMLPLDADSVMDGETIVKMARICQKYPKIGILQGLVVGLPSKSAFARMFQFGMRHGMRSYTMGQAWWVGDCGPFWGHNAFVAIKPFYEECALPYIDGKGVLSGAILSHDQVEATLMRKAGFEARIYPIEAGSYEENPPSLPTYMARDVRWCQGNLQYIHLLNVKGLQPVSRFQLLWAILMFIGVPAWTVMLGLLPLKLIDGEDWAGFPAGLAIVTYLTYLIMYLMPKIAGVVDILISDKGVNDYGGMGKFTISAITELVFSFLVGAASTFRITQFMAGLVMGKSISWSSQQRDAESLSWGEAKEALLPQTLFGLYILTPLWFFAPAVFWWSLPLTLGFLLAIPMAVVTASPRVGAWFVKHQICGIPEDFNPSPIVQTVMKA
jgi:membrane glycosyltransferase